jgi:tetratricopeptide (TPR) repeat protein
MLRSPRSAIALVVVLCSLLAAACSNGPGPGGAPGDVDRMLASALQAHAEGHLREAVDLYERILVLDPQNKFAYYNLGLIDQTQGRVDAAAANYVQAIEIDPAFTPALFNLAIIRADQGAADEAIELYRDVLAVNADDAGAHLNLGFLLLDQGHRKPGRAELAIAVQIDPSLESRIPEGLVVVGGATGP